MSTEIAQVDPAQLSPATTYRDYSAEFKAQALVLLKANSNNVLRTANQLGIPEPTLRLWVRNGIDTDLALYERKAQELATNFEEIAFRVTELAEARLNDPTKADAIPFQSLMLGGAIATDKSLVLRGQPTSIIATATIDDLRELQLAAQSVAQSQQIPVYDACLRLAEELNDVPELANQLRTWAESELKGK